MRWNRLLVGAGLAAGIHGCTGHLERFRGEASRADAADAAATDTPSTGTSVHGLQCDPSAPFDPGPSPLRRLTHREYRLSIQQLFGSSISDPTPGFPADSPRHGFVNNAEAIAVSNLLVEKYRDAAEQLAAEALSGGAIAGCAVSDGEACLQTFIETFGRRAFRRPLSNDERVDYLSLAKSASNARAGVELVLRAMLLSPNFLFRPEVGTPSQLAGVLRLTGFELATRLSYLLTGAPPADDLLAAAEQGDLEDPQGLDRAARRLLESPGARDSLRDFAGQWLRLNHITVASRSPETFPSWNSELVASMGEETLRFVGDFVWQPGADFLELLTARHTYMDKQVAALYGLDLQGAWQRVDLSGVANRGGVLTQPAVLTATAKHETSLPILRGHFVRTVLMCQDLPPAPPNVPVLPPAEPGESDRQRLARHQTDPACSSCHALMDPLGFGLAGFDVIGRARELDSTGQPVETAGSFSGFDRVDFNGPLELSALLKQRPEVQRCVAVQLFRYGHARKEAPADACRIQHLEETFARSGRGFLEMLLALVTSDDFRHRRDHDR